MLQFKGWWEYYVLRYLVGTVVGASVIFVISSDRTTLASLISSGVEWKNLAALAALGFAYCYIASAPMLTLHVIRPCLFKAASAKLDAMVWVWVAVPALVVGAILGEIWPIGFTCSRLLHCCLFDPLVNRLAIVSFFFLVSAQFILIGRAYSKGSFPTIMLFYERLAWRRVGHAQDVGEYVESYRHIREHSNALAIVVLEILLAPVLALASESRQLIPIALLWLLPSACCWLIATVLEVKLSERN